LHSLGRYDEAVTSYDHAISIDPSDADAWNSKGNSLNSMGKSNDAKKCYDKSKELGYSE